ncbi:hypothetical protein [Amorphus sp. MBR-141]
MQTGSTARHGADPGPGVLAGTPGKGAMRVDQVQRGVFNAVPALLS